MPRKQYSRTSVTIREVALAAGVSTATVSRVLSGQDQRVGPERAERVRLVAQNLRYQPNAAARSLRAKKSDPVRVPPEAELGPFVSEIVAGIDGFLQRHGLAVVLTQLRDTTRRNESQHELPGHPANLSALTFSAFALGEAAARLLLQRTRPLDNEPTDPALPPFLAVHASCGDDGQSSEPSAGSIYHSAVVLPGTKSRSE